MAFFFVLAEVSQISVKTGANEEDAVDPGVGVADIKMTICDVGGQCCNTGSIGGTLKSNETDTIQGKIVV